MLTVSVAAAAAVTAVVMRSDSASCDEVPCVNIPRCSSGRMASLSIDQLSNGKGSAQASSLVSICYDMRGLVIKHVATGQKYLSENSYNNCNDEIYNLNVAELFIAPVIDAEPEASHCYNEIDISPGNVMFESGIYNSDLSQSTIKNSLIDCETSGVGHFVTVDKDNETWTSVITLPWSIANKPFACPIAEYTKVSATAPVAQYRANLYRVNELMPVGQQLCSSSSCEYLAWSPTMVDPPAFHCPRKFGYLILEGVEEYYVKDKNSTANTLKT